VATQVATPIDDASDNNDDNVPYATDARFVNIHNDDNPIHAMNVKPKKGCWGKFCDTLKKWKLGGRKTKRLRKKHTKTGNIKKKHKSKRMIV